MNLVWKRALFALCIFGGLTFTSCSQDDGLVDGPDTTDPIEEEGSFFSFKMLSGLDIMLPSTRAVEDGDDPENAVEEGLWVLYDDSDKVAYSEILDAKTTGASGNVFNGDDVAASTNRASFTMKAKKVKVQDYRLLVVLNPTSEIKASTTVGKYISAFEEAQTTSVNAVSKDVSGIRSNIVMTNANGLVAVDKDLHLYKKAEEAETGRKPLVQVDRILAKVTFQMKSPIEYPNGGELTNAVWKLDITNKKTYWMRRKAYYAPLFAGAANSNSSQWVMEDGTETDRAFYYAEDPNFDHFSIFRTGGTNNLPLLSEFDFETTGEITDMSTTKPLSGTPTREYVLENTMNAQEQWEDVTTRALIRGNYIPGGYKNIPATPADPKIPFAAGDSYYFFGGTAMSFNQIKAWYDDIINDNKNYPWPTAPSGVKDAVVKAVTDGFINFSVAEGRATSGSNGKLHFYKDGISYYSTLIRHFSDAYSSNEGFEPETFNFGRYGVVRNNVYKMTLTKITGPGKPNIPDPEGPDDKEEKYLSTEIEVLPWVIREQNVEL